MSGIQSMYYKSGKLSIDHCFDSEGRMLYTLEKGSRPMQIEVPLDEYEAALSEMRKRMEQGQIPGSTNGLQAEDIVRKGCFTYEQAKAIAKFETVPSIRYDETDEDIVVSAAFSVSTILTFATGIWNNEEYEIALKSAVYTGLEIGGTTYVASVLEDEIATGEIAAALEKGTEEILRILGPKATIVVVNAYHGGKKLLHTSVLKCVKKLLHGSKVTAGVAVIVMSVKDVIAIVRGRISGKQLFKNITQTSSAVAGGTVGWLGGAAAGTAVCPGVGTVVGGIIGSLGTGIASGKASKAALDALIEDDVEKMVKILEEQLSIYAALYMLNSKEIEYVVESLKKILNKKTLQLMYASKDEREYANALLLPMIEKVAKERQIIEMPAKEKIEQALKEVLEEIEDEYEYEREHYDDVTV